MSDENVLLLERTLPARREIVYGAMTSPGQLGRWWGPHGFRCPRVDFTPRVGDRYRIAMQPPAGEVFHLSGEFREVEPPSRLAYTFVWDPPDPNDCETLATLTLTEDGDETRVKLTQGPFKTEARADLHKAGWSDSFDRLDEFLASLRR